MPAPTSARRNYTLSALIARRAVREARKVRQQGTGAIAGVVVAHQLANAQSSQAAVLEMLDEQGIASAPDAALDIATFSTSADLLASMLAELDRITAEMVDQSRAETVYAQKFDQLVDDLVQDAARAAESVAVAVRPNIYHVRYLSPPSCGRCAVLAGRVYRWSEGFLRHPNCDCVMIPTTVAAPFAQSPADMVRQGQVKGLSKADEQALEDGADLAQVVNVRLRSAGLRESGFALTRGGRPTPAGIYRLASDREDALRLLARYGYIR